ncbi:uncharacterized membrane protein YccC [Jatrophihabitans sp. GAS493]|nr:uncharacterized membrane protein YccC [Jatrophihabitans sp. GAS493]
MPLMFALGDKVFDNAALATFAAFGSFAMLIFVDFGGPMRDRLQAQVALIVTGAVFVCVGTLCSQVVWLSAVAMAVVGFAVLFAGVVSSVLASATTSLLLAFILPVTLSGPPSQIPDRLAGWGLAGAASLIAITVLWPAPIREPLRRGASAACRALAARLRTEVAYLLSNRDETFAQEHQQAIEQAQAAVHALHTGFLATPYRPTGLSTSNRTIVRLVDELTWLDTIVVQSGQWPSSRPANPAACAVKGAAANVLERGADLLDVSGGDPKQLAAAQAELGAALERMERDATHQLPVRDDGLVEFLTSLDPSFRAQELSFAASVIAANIDLTAAAERRSWLERLLGRQPGNLLSTFGAARERAGAHVERHSVWLHNSLRGAAGLGLAVLVANLTGVQHSFWVVLGTLSVLRSNALNTGQNILRALIGTVIGFVIGALLLAVIGTNTTLLWWLLPPVILLAGVAPAAISFAAGQAAFTLTLVILFNIIQPTGWQIGLVRVEDIAIGCIVSLLVGALFWPRGAGAALRRALAEAYVDSAEYLAGAVEVGMLRCDSGAPPPSVSASESAVRAAAASRRLDDTFRNFLAERGAKPVPLAEVTTMVTGVAGLRLAADAVTQLWQRDDGTAVGDRVAARAELLAFAASVRGWYADLAVMLVDGGALREPSAHDKVADGRLVEAVRHDLRGEDGRASATAVRMIWTGDHLDAARRLERTIIVAAQAVAAPG